MILSSVNFIKTNSRQQKSHFDFSDFILGKIREDQEKRDAACQRCGSPQNDKTDRLSHRKLTPQNSVNSEKSDTTKREVKNVTIETKDGYVLSLSEELNRIYLGEEEDPNNSNIFRQRTFQIEEGDKTLEACSFELHSQGQLYLSVSADRQLQVQKSDTTVDHTCPDERVFVLHNVSNGSVFLQPYHHKGYYLHHLDNSLQLRKLEINWRPPEEYFFNVGIVDIPDAEVFVSAEEVIPTIENELKQKNKTDNHSPKINLLWGCFGGKSKKLSSKLKKTIKQKSRV